MPTREQNHPLTSDERTVYDIIARNTGIASVGLGLDRELRAMKDRARDDDQKMHIRTLFVAKKDEHPGELINARDLCSTLKQKEISIGRATLLLSRKSARRLVLSEVHDILKNPSLNDEVVKARIAALTDGGPRIKRELNSIVKSIAEAKQIRLKVIAQVRQIAKVITKKRTSTSKMIKSSKVPLDLLLENLSLDGHRENPLGRPVGTNCITSLPSAENALIPKSTIPKAEQDALMAISMVTAAIAGPLFIPS